MNPDAVTTNTKGFQQWNPFFVAIRLQAFAVLLAVQKAGRGTPGMSFGGKICPAVMHRNSFVSMVFLWDQTSGEGDGGQLAMAHLNMSYINRSKELTV